MENGDNTPATKADLAKQQERLLEAMHDTETRLLRAFYSFAQSNQQRMTHRLNITPPEGS